uniref:Root meristem growth factor 2-like n=1 Tax=Tanacetum cinerariifolium TaxID=118510 RepID=A0A6L2M682_TANCI|nr:root meristem growth factor 2-like [Tanacetum cinerariifolium]
MISLRFIVMSSLLFFVIASTCFTAFQHTGGKKAGFIATSDEKVSPKKVYVVAAAAAARENTLRGRKMVVDKSIMLKKYEKINVMAREQRTRLKRITYSGNKNVNFVAYTEDYGKPKRHPPKNN